MKKCCTICDAEYETRHIQSKYCSDDCRLEARTCSICGYVGKDANALRVHHKKIHTPKECKICGSHFTIHETGGHTYCSDECRAKKHMKKNCALCDAEFEVSGKNASQKYCGLKCSKEAKRLDTIIHQRRYRIKHREKCKAYRKEYTKRPEVRERINARQRRPEARARVNAWQNEKNKEPKRKVANSVRSTIQWAIKRKGIAQREWKKSKKTFDILGYTPIELVKHIESQFTDGMSWDNHSRHGWHIDHIRPVASFNFDSMDHPEFKECWALENLQPLWATDDIRISSLWEGKRYRNKVIQ